MIFGYDDFVSPVPTKKCLVHGLIHPANDTCGFCTYDKMIRDTQSTTCGAGDESSSLN